VTGYRRCPSAVVERFLSARELRDVGSCLALVAEDATWHSPVGPPQRGREGFRRAIEEAYADTRWFATETLGVREHGDSVVARVRNRGEREGESLDSVQRLVFRLTDGLISDVRIHVDDPSAVSSFWSDGP
jgi:ketosteroid isomerase-like protein